MTSSHLLVPLLALLVVLNSSAARLSEAAKEFDVSTKTLCELDRRSLAFRSAYHVTAGVLEVYSDSPDVTSWETVVPLGDSLAPVSIRRTGASAITTLLLDQECLEISIERVEGKAKVLDVVLHARR